MAPLRSEPRPTLCGEAGVLLVTLLFLLLGWPPSAGRCASEEEKFPDPFHLLEGQWTSQDPAQAVDFRAYAREKTEGPEEALPLTLKEAVRLAVLGNYDMRAEGYTPRIAELEITRSQGVFDTVLNSSYLHDYVSELTSSQLQGTEADVSNLLKVRTITSEVGLEKMVETGAKLGLRLDVVRFGSNSTFLTLNPSYSSHLSFSVAQPLLKNAGLGFQRAPIRMAENRYWISEEQWKGFAADIVAQVIQAYWDLVFALQTRGVRQSSLDLARQLLRENERRVHLGTLAPVELLQSQTGVALRQEELLDADAVLHGAQDRLKGLLQWDEAPVRSSVTIAPVDVPPDVPVEERIDLQGAVDVALKSRPEYRSARKDLENKNLQIKVAQNQLLPSLDLTGVLGLNGLGGTSVESTDFFALSQLTDVERLLVALGLLEVPRSESPLDGGLERSFRELFDTQTYQWTFGVRLQIPLENRAAKSEYLQSKMDAYKSLWSLRSVEEKISLEVKGAWRDLQTEREKVRTSDATQSFARQQFEAEQKKLALGLSTNYQLLKMEEDLRNAQVNHLRSMIEYWKARVRFEKAKGSLLESEGVRLEDVTPARRG
ncbi:MAG: TolC family protein [bacterium]